MKAEKKQGKHGIFFGILFALCHTVADFFASGAVFRIFTSYKRAESAFENCATVTLFRCVGRKLRPVGESVRKYISRQFEDSLILKVITSLSSRLFSLPARTFGSFTLTWGAYVVIISLSKRYLLMVSESVATDVLCGAIVLFTSFPLILSDKPFCTLCTESPTVFALLNGIFGVPPEAMKPEENVRPMQSVAVIFGIVLGSLTYLFSPYKMLLGCCALVCVALILAYPEGGVIISVAAAPFLGLTFAPSRILAAIVLLTALSYAIKVVRGKRVFSFGITVCSFFAFMAAVLLAGFAPGTSNTLEHAVLCCALMLVFPLTVNLMKYRRWIKVCASVFVFPAVVIAFIGIVQYSLGLAPQGWLDESLFAGISSRAVSLFNNPNILGAYLTMTFPIVLTLTLPHNQPKMRLLGYILAAFVAICTVFTYSRSSWIALLVGGLAFAVMISPKGILLLLPAGASAVAAALLFPSTVGARLKNFITLSDSANNSRVAVWNSSWNMLADVFAGGVGMGEEAFRTAYIGYAAAGTQYTVHSHSLYMQIVLQMGAVGLVLFLVFLFSSTQRCCTSISIKSSDDFLSSVTKAALAGAFALLAAGMFDYTWYNYRIFFMFWALLGFACAAANLNDRSRSEIYLGGTEMSFFSVTVPITKRSENFDLSDIEKEVVDND